MLNETRNMRQTATYWPPGAPDGEGGHAFGAARNVKVRWQQDAVLFRDAHGREQMSNAVVYPAEPLDLGGYLYLGTTDEADPKAVAGALEIRQRGQSPDLGQTFALNKVWL